MPWSGPAKGKAMPAFALVARPAAAALVLAVGLVAGTARADPFPATPLVADPPVVLPLRPDPILLELGVRLGGIVRIGDAPSFSIDSRTGYLLGVSALVALSPRFSLGLVYEHAELGSEQGAGAMGTVDIDRSLDSLWATLRLNLFRIDGFALAVVLGPGLVWQHEDVNAFAFDNTDWRPTAFQCTASDGPGLGLRAGLGAELHLGGGFVLNLDGTIDELRLSSDGLGTCAPGAGSTAVVGVRGGFSYRVDVSRYVR
jgi:hypothetical protein